MPRTNIYAIHGGLLLISFLGVTVGISVIIWEKNVNAIEHFTSTHALLGQSLSQTIVYKSTINQFIRIDLVVVGILRRVFGSDSRKNTNVCPLR